MTADEIEMAEDSKMADIAWRTGKMKCLRIGCMTMLPRNHATGLCRFHARCSRELQNARRRRVA